jgi:hypothetical protein
LVPGATERRSEDQSNPHSKADIVYGDPKPGTENEAFASATLRFPTQ